MKLQILILLLCVHFSFENEEGVRVARKLLRKIWKLTRDGDKETAKRYFSNKFYFETCGQNYSSDYYLDRLIDSDTRPYGAKLEYAEVSKFVDEPGYRLSFGIASPRYSSDFLASHKNRRWKIDMGRTNPTNCDANFMISNGDDYLSAEQ